MRVVQFLQVMVLFLLMGYLLLVALNNPVVIHLPVPLVGRELLLSSGAVLLLTLLLGISYGALLTLPLLWQGQQRRRHDQQRRRQAEAQLQAALRARLATVGTPSTPAPSAPIQPIQPVSPVPTEAQV